MSEMEAKLKHLDYIQAAIARMANHSFLFKGWSITMVGALFAFAVVEAKWALVVVALFATLLFWGLDGYYLWIERGFVELHKQVSVQTEAEIDLSMAIDKHQAFSRWLRTCLRPHIIAFYGTVVLVELVGIFVVRIK